MRVKRATIIASLLAAMCVPISGQNSQFAQIWNYHYGLAKWGLIQDTHYLMARGEMIPAKDDVVLRELNWFIDNPWPEGKSATEMIDSLNRNSLIIRLSSCFVTQNSIANRLQITGAQIDAQDKKVLAKCLKFDR